MFGVGHLPELIIVLTIILIFFGAKRLPEIGSGMGKSIVEFRKATNELSDEESGRASATVLQPSAVQEHGARVQTASPSPSD